MAILDIMLHCVTIVQILSSKGQTDNIIIGFIFFTHVSLVLLQKIMKRFKVGPCDYSSSFQEISDVFGNKKTTGNSENRQTHRLLFFHGNTFDPSLLPFLQAVQLPLLKQSWMSQGLSCLPHKV